QGIAQYTSDPVFRRLVRDRAAAAEQEPDRGTGTRVSVAAIRTLLSIARRHPGPLWENLRSPLARTAVELFTDIYSRPSISWRDLAWLRERTSLPLLLKGILHPDDARLAVEHGVDGIIVSTHGGRQVDGSIGSMQALPRVLDAVDGAVPVLLDSGVRGGTDVAKALHLGADAVLVGRAWAYGLAAGGERGVREVIENLVAELDLTMCLLGCSDVAQLRQATVLRRSADGQRE
ncbi:MAG TPA: alpha-hydroxy-acid oxidizing protein, partial [Segeticoccus sp.]|nr:alpha-hydroxy-acid oxidizing protein [Segeticoccus sp.]